MTIITAIPMNDDHIAGHFAKADINSDSRRSNDHHHSHSDE